MRRSILFATLVMILFMGVAEAKTVHELLNRNNRANAAYDMSIIPELLKSNANVYFVDNENTAAYDQVSSHGERPEYPFKTYEFAVNQCDAGENNIIVILPYSQENVTAASVDVDITGITTIGIGYGPARPKFISTATGSTFVVGRTGDGATFKNITFEAGISAVVVGVQIEDGADNISFVDCEWLDASTSTYEFNTAVDVVTEVNDLSFERCQWTSVTAGATAAIDIGDGAVAGLTVKDCVVYGDYATAGFFSDTALTDVVIDNVLFYNANADEFGIEFQGTSNLGFMSNCAFLTSGNYWDLGGIMPAGNTSATIADITVDPVTGTLDAILVDTGTTLPASLVLIDNDTYWNERTVVVTDVNVADGSVEDVLTIAGGPILVTSLSFVLTEAASNNSVTMAFESDPTTGAGDLNIASAVDIDNTAVGGWVYAEGDGSAAVISAIGGNVAQGCTVPCVVPIGGLDIIMGSANLTTGIGNLYISYIPKSTGVTVAE